MGGVVFPPFCLNWEQTMVEVMKIMTTSFKMSCACTATLSAPTLQQATADPRFCWRLLNTQRQIWVSLLWGHCSFLLGPVTYTLILIFFPSECLFPQSFVNSGNSMVQLMATSSKRAYATPRSAAPRAPAPGSVHCWSIPQQKTLKGRSGLVSVGSPCVHKVYNELRG